MLESATVNKDEQVSNVVPAAEQASEPGFIRRYRLPLSLAVIAVCLYAGSILYILFGRGVVV